MQQRGYRVSLVVLCCIVGNLMCLADGAAQTPSPTPTPVLTLSKIGEGMGEILVDGLVVCPVTCRDTTIPFHEGDTLTIDATPSSGSFLEGWNINGIPVTPVSGSLTVMPGDIVTAIFAPVMSASLEPCELLGDVDEDGSITLIDGLLVLVFCRGFQVDIAEPCADVNCDDAITREDAWLILQYVFGWISEFPCSPPISAFSATPLSGPVPLTVVFTNESSGTITQSAWSFGDGAHSSEANPEHTYTTAGQYSVSLTVSGPGGADELLQADYIEALPNQTPIVTITSPEAGAVVPAGSLDVEGTVLDDGAVVSVHVNDVLAQITGDSFSATVSLGNGNQLITVVAEDHGGAMGLTERLVRVDGDGPLIAIQSPKRGQAVYTLTPEIAISYHDFYTDVETASLQVQLVDEHSVTTDVTGDLTITDEGAQGTLSSPLTEDTQYTLNVSLADTLGNVSQSAATFYVPLDPASITPPAETEGDGWITGTVFDSTSCNEHLQGCTPLSGARVTLSYAGDLNDTIPGTIVTGSNGFFAFPLPETGIYWIRVQHSDYTYAQREVEVVRQHSTAIDDIYLTPLDPAMTPCDETGCSHTSSDGILQVEIPAGAIPAGQTIEVRATNFRHVEFLPSGGLPPGTWETYAFNLGGDSEVEFAVPITVKIQNARGFDPGTEIPLGYWNQTTLKWEHEGVGTVDAAGAWVEMPVTHLSNYDCNCPIAPLEGVNTKKNDQTSGHGTGPCASGEGKCFIDVKSGTFTEDYSLSSVPVLGQEVAPRLAYSSRRVTPSEVIDLEFSVDPYDPSAELGNYVGLEVYIEGQKTDEFSFSATLQPGELYRYRYFWDGRDARGTVLPPGVYEYRVKVSIPYRAQYYYALNRIFGGPPDYVNGATGRFVDATADIWVRGTIALNTHSDSPLGAGWVLAGQQRLVADEAGRILISDGARNDEFSHPRKDLLQQARQDLAGMLVWANYGPDDQTIQTIPETRARTWNGSQPDDITTIAVGDEPYTLALSSDGQFAYVAAEGHGGETMPVVNLNIGQVFDSVTVDLMPAAIALSPDETLAYVAHWGSNTLSVVDLALRQEIAAIPITGTGRTAVAVSPDGAWAYVTSRVYDNNVAVVDLNAQEVLTSIGVGTNPTAIALSPDGMLAYVVNSGDDTLSVLDLETWQQVAVIPVGNAPQFLALSPDGTMAYVTNSGGNTVSVVDLTSQQEVDSITVGAQPHGIAVSVDGAVAYVANRGENSIAVIDLHTRQVVAQIPTGSEPVGIALSGSGLSETIMSRTATDDSRLDYDDQSATYTRVYPNGTQVHFNPDGTHDYTLDRHGNKTAYTYNSSDGTTATMTITPAGEATPRWTWTFSYQDGRLSEITDPAGRTTTFSIDGNNHLTTIESPLEGGQGGVRRFAYDSRGLMTHATDELGHSTTHMYDQYGRITQVQHAPTGSGQETLTFSPADMGAPFINDSPVGDPDNPAPPAPVSADLIARVDYERGSLSGHTDTWGRWLDKTDALGRTTTYQRDEAGNLLQRRYPDGSCDEYTYDSNKNLLSKSRMDAAQCALAPENRDPAQVLTTWYTYEDRFTRIKTKTDPQGNTTTYIYDYEESVGNAGNLIRIESPQVEDETGTVVTPTVHYSYNGWGQISSETDARGTVTRYVYTQGTSDEASDGATPLFLPGVTPVPGLLTQVITDDGGIAEITTYTDFDAAGNPGTIIGPGCCGSGQETHYTYDALGRVLTKEDALGIITTYEYDATGNLVRTIEDYTADGTTGRNVVTDSTYDANGNLLTQRTVAENIISETTRTYDENGKLASITDANGNTSTYTYDDADQLESVTDPKNQTTSYTYTEKGFLETTTLPNGTVVRYIYNALGQKVQEIEDDGGLNLTTSYTYDHNGNLETRTDPEGVVTRYTYDALNRLISETQDEGGLNLTTSYRYDQAGNLRFLTDAKNQTTEMVYDALNRLRKEIRPMTEETAYWYDEADNLEEKQDAKGQTTTYTYNNADQLTQISYEGGKTVMFTYDRVGNLETYNDGTTSATYTYDDLGRKLSETVNYGAFSKTFSYTYYDNGLKKAFIMPDGMTYSYAYDDNDRLTHITIPGLGDITYPSYTLNRPDSVTFPGGSQQTYTYDDLMRIEQIVSSPSGMDYQYTSYDGVSNILTKTTEHGNYTYEYDDVYRLTTVDNPTLDDEAYTYDEVGNWETESGVSGSWSYNLNNELLGYEDVEYDYDDNGNLTQITVAGSVVWTYTYDAANRLVHVEDGTGTISADYYYDPFGRRLWKDVGGVRTYIFYADEGLVAEYDENGAEIRSYGYKPDSTWTTDPLWQKVGSMYYWYQNDHLGTPQKLVDIGGTVVWSAQYTAFGKADVQIEMVTNNLRFPGQFFDDETGLHYNLNRYYDPKIGRYLQTDPIGFLGGNNMYAYVVNNPVKFFDPFGFQSHIGGRGQYGGGLWPSPDMWPTPTPTVEPPPLNECVEGIGACIARKALGYVGQTINCADVAIKALIECAAEKNVPLTLPRIADVKKNKYTCFRSKDYKTPQAFFNAAQVLNAGDLFRENKITVPRDFEQLIPGDLILYNLDHHRNQTGATYTGHTRVVINNGKSWFLFYSGTTEIGAPAGSRLPYTKWPLWWVPSIEVVEGHLSMPVERNTYAYEQLLREWLGPIAGKGRTWNCEIFKDCPFTKECGR